ncbi:helix-turn-helix domain-containing protein [Saccharopolyspora karakumensis]|nr:helix-turn-helix domain-containing protein [Saccharopolyspora karakumensis]
MSSTRHTALSGANHPEAGASGRGAGGTESIEAQSPREWADVIREVYGGLDVMARTQQPFKGVLIRRSLDRLQTVELRISPQFYQRTASLAKQHPSEDLFVTMIVEGQALVVQDGRSCELNAGDFVFVEGQRPYSVILGKASRLIDFAWSQHGVGLSWNERRQVTARTFSAKSPIGRWLSPALLGLHEMEEGVSEFGAARLADGIACLLVTAALELTSPNGPADRWRQQYDEMVRFIKRNIDDPDLSADSLVENFFMSGRSVHRIFAKFGTTPAAIIRDMRLEEARRMMLSRAYQTQSVSFIASQLGFSSLQVFSRAFRAKYGVGPKRYRLEHQ